MPCVRSARGRERVIGRRWLYPPAASPSMRSKPAVSRFSAAVCSGVSERRIGAVVVERIDRLVVAIELVVQVRRRRMPGVAGQRDHLAGADALAFRHAVLGQVQELGEHAVVERISMQLPFAPQFQFARVTVPAFGALHLGADRRLEVHALVRRTVLEQAGDLVVAAKGPSLRRSGASLPSGCQ